MRIHLEGWRFLPHSIAIANQFQLGEMLPRSELQLSVQDLPYSDSNWQAVPNLFDSTSQHQLNQLSETTSRDADVLLRMAEPLNFKSSDRANHTLVLALAEWGTLFDPVFLKKNLGTPVTLDENVTIITPSNWSKLGLVRSGIDADKVKTIPWGVDPKIYQPLTSENRKALRQQLGWDDYFIFLNVSSMEDKTGIRPLLKAFLRIVEQYPQAKLILKGCDAIYPSKQSLFAASKSILSEADVDKIKPHIAYLGETFSFQKIAQLYQAADAYVCPYVASAFHLSALEAMACGLPIICTEGGATDDFVHPDFSLKIQSKFRTRALQQRLNFFLHPDWEHLVELMGTVIEKSELRQQAREKLPKFVQNNYTWKHTVDQLLEVLEKPEPPQRKFNQFFPVYTQNSSLRVEGWRFIPHSYSLINSYQLIELNKHQDIQLFYQDMPYVSESWKATEGLLSPHAEQALKKIPIATENKTTDVTLRMYCPFNLANSQSQKTFTFACTEWGVVPQTILRGMQVTSFRDAHLNSETIIITSSHWSKQGFINSGADPERIVVVPLGIDPQVYFPLNRDKRQALRQKMGWNDSFVFLNIGVMWNERQGVDRLLKAFAILTEKYSDIRLILKGRDAIFPSKESIQKVSRHVLTEAEAERVKPRIQYIGENLSALEMAELFQAADAYVSPYSAEGFNLPVLEAMACGLPVICTSGGSTDDFVHPEYVWKIDSKIKISVEKNGDIKFFLDPNNSHLLELMEAMINNSTFRTQAYQTTPQYVIENFTWKHIVDRLVNIMF
ncbi:MAG: glycosyltransferase [Cyanobacteria bacterium J06592_8]